MIFVIFFTTKRARVIFYFKKTNSERELNLPVTWTALSFIHWSLKDFAFLSITLPSQLVSIYQSIMKSTESTNLLINHQLTIHPSLKQGLCILVNHSFIFTCISNGKSKILNQVYQVLDKPFIYHHSRTLAFLSITLSY